MEDQPACISTDPQLPSISSVNWMPFHIAHDGPAPTASQYFSPQLQQPDASLGSSSSSSTPQWVAHFRGRQLRGATKQLPQGFTGLVLKPAGGDTGSSTSDAQQRSWQATGSFSEVVLWGHDAAPAASDATTRCIDWLALADQVHKPVSAAQVEEELQRMQQTAGA